MDKLTECVNATERVNDETSLQESVVEVSATVRVVDSSSN